MDEPTPTAENTESGRTYSTSFSLHMAELAKLSDLAQRTKRKQSDIVREAINMMYAAYGPQEPHE